MCGILGLIDKRGFDKELLVKMRDTLTHRGPNDYGTWINPDGSLGFAHRRLSVIDLSDAGRQPMCDSKGKIWITYNGEIYNFKELRNELKNKGHIFRSRTDTEVIIYAYKEWGIKCVNKLNGMFAFGIYDMDNNKVFFARDRAGKKPLYYAEYNSRLAFSSELKAFFQDNAFPNQIDINALNFYLTYGYIPGELCILKNVKKLPPAHVMTYDINTEQKKISCYWKLPEYKNNRYSEKELLYELEKLLEDAVRIRMISDVPLGAFLSGGIDSSLVVAMMSRVSGKPVKTFSIGFEESKYNELPFAKLIAGHFNTDHHEIIVKPDAFSIFNELIYQFDEPFADSSMIPTFFVSKATRQNVTVALSGDGGDELFGGYNRYRATLGNYYAAKVIPEWLRKLVSKSAGYLPEKIIGKRQLLRLKHDPYGAFIDRVSHNYFKKRYRKHILNEDILNELSSNFQKPENCYYSFLSEQKYDFINNLASLDFKTYLSDDILVKVDRASMLVSLEVRSPFLDYRIAEFAFRNIPGNLKVKNIITKYLLKKLAKRILPKGFEINRKWGFAIPVSRWFKGVLFNNVKELLLEHSTNFFNKGYIEKLLAEHKAGINHSTRLFTLLSFMQWEKHFLTHSYNLE